MSDKSKIRQDNKTRAAYIRAKLGSLIPAQIRALRQKSMRPALPRQTDLAKEAGMHQSRISQLEKSGNVNVTLDTLVNLASALRCGLKIEFVPFSEMLKWENEFSPDKFDVVRLEDDAEFLSGTCESEINTI